MSIRCNTNLVRNNDEWPSFEHRTIGQMVRDARDFGVLPEMEDVQGAFDDSDSNEVDPFANPRSDRFDLYEQYGDKVALNVAPVPPAPQVAPTESTTE